MFENPAKAFLAGSDQPLSSLVGYFGHFGVGYGQFDIGAVHARSCGCAVHATGELDLSWADNDVAADDFTQLYFLEQPQVISGCHLELSLAATDHIRLEHRTLPAHADTQVGRQVRFVVDLDAVSGRRAATQHQLLDVVLEHTVPDRSELRRQRLAGLVHPDATDLPIVGDHHVVVDGPLHPAEALGGHGGLLPRHAVEPYRAWQGLVDREGPGIVGLVVEVYIVVSAHDALLVMWAERVGSRARPSDRSIDHARLVIAFLSTS
ncbi:hypothetical protein D3C78_1246450 [compost metagenome]